MAAEQRARDRLIDLSHPIEAGMSTYPGLPVPEIRQHLTREASRGHYAPGVEFRIDVITLCGNTGTYVDSPAHRHAGGADLAGLPLERLVDVPAVRIDATGAGRAVTASVLRRSRPARDGGRWSTRASTVTGARRRTRTRSRS